MYTDDEKRVGLPLKTFVLSLILIIIFILLLMWLLPIPSKTSSNNESGESSESCSKDGKCPDFPNITGLTNRVFVENIKDMKETAISYFTTDKLPVNEGGSVILTLQDMLDKHLILPITDKNGNACDTKGSYVTLTKLKDSYEMKVNLKCGEEEAYILVPLGCYSYCTSGVCEDKDKKTPVVPIPVGPTPKPTPTPTPSTSTPYCTLKVLNGKVGDNGWYVGDVVLGFATKGSTNGATITAFGLGKSVVYDGVPTLTVNNDGVTTINGYVKDSNGKTATCSITVKRDATKPSCELKVNSGTRDASGVYVSDVEIGFASRIDATSGIANFGLTNGPLAIYNRFTKYLITKDGEHKIYGYVMDNAGNASVCNISIKRETPPTPVSNPSCTLKVLNGQVGDNGWYVGNVGIGFASKTTTGGATITAFGLGLTETFDGSTTYLVNNDGTTTVNGYVKDSNGYIASCSITVKKDAEKPNCKLEVISGKYKNGYYISDVVVGFASKTDLISGVSAFGLGKSETYNGNPTYKVTDLGTHTVYGYVKDKAGNKTSCDISFIIRDNTEYEYKKDIAAKYSNWSEWTTSTYNPSNPPKFGHYALIEMEDLGKKTVVDYYKESTGKAFYKYKTVEVGTIKETYCTGYDYYRDKTTNKTVAVQQGSSWKSAGMVTTSGWPTDTMSVKYDFVGYDWKCTGCETTPRKIWNKSTRTTYVASSTSTVTTSSDVVVKCSGTETKTVHLFDTVKVFVDYEIIKTPVYKDVYSYKKRTRSLIHKAYVDYKWSYYDNKSLLNLGYTYTGKTRPAE